MLYAFIKLLSRTPLPLLYVLSDVLYLLMFRVIKYRKKVVMHNLRGAFPNRSEQERQKIASDFYRIFCDFLVETLKGLTISKEEISKRFQIEGLENMTRHLNKGQSIVCVLGHQFNWEWLNLALGATTNYSFSGIYMPMKNPTAERFVVTMRTRFGSKLMAKNEAAAIMRNGSNETIAYGIVGDQTPNTVGARNAYWTTFMHQDAAFFKGMAWMGPKLGYPIIMFQLQRVKRGYYKAVFKTIRDIPYSSPEEDLQIIEEYVRELEAELEKNPANWLWTHKRWKLKRSDYE